MSKIALIASGHAGSTMPLIKAFLDKGYDVDYYILCNKEVKDIEATDCNYIPSHRGISQIPVASYPKLQSEYIQSVRFRIFCISTYRPFENNYLLNKAVGIARTWQIKKACQFINKQNYEFVNFIGRYKVTDIVRYARYIKTKYIVSLHEVCNHITPNFEQPNSVLNYLFKHKIPIVLYSDKSLEDMKKYKGVNHSYLYRENFGLFESFKIYSGRHDLSLPGKYVLFIGRLTPYKGLRLFYEATKDLANQGYKFVVAGNGKDEALEDIKSTPNYTVINMYLTDEDFVELIERCSFVVCPYTSISQSGIPQTVFVFNKPIVATDLDGFREIIIDKKNGLLFELNKTSELTQCITKAITDENVMNELIAGAKNFDGLFPNYSWNTISDKYEEDFIKRKHEPSNFIK